MGLRRPEPGGPSVPLGTMDVMSELKGKARED